MSSERKLRTYKMESPLIALLFILHRANGHNRLFAPCPFQARSIEGDGELILSYEGPLAFSFVQIPKIPTVFSLVYLELLIIHFCIFATDARYFPKSMIVRLAKTDDLFYHFSYKLYC